MRDEDLYTSGVFASELDEDLNSDNEDVPEGGEILEPELDDIDEDDDLYGDVDDDDPDGNYNPMDDYRKDGWE